MAGKTKNWYVSVMDSEIKKQISSKMFYSINDANKYIKEIEVEFPKPRYQIYKETY